MGVVLADCHHGLTEGMRGLLETVFVALVMVADETSQVESAERLQPSLVAAEALARAGVSAGCGDYWLAFPHHAS